MEGWKPFLPSSNQLHYFNGRLRKVVMAGKKFRLGPWWCPKFDYATRQNRPGYVRCSKAIWVWFDRRKAHVLLKLDLFYHLYVSHSSSGTACWERCSLMTLHLHDFYTPWFLFKRLVPAYIYKYISNFNLQKLQEDPKSLSIPGGLIPFSHLWRIPSLNAKQPPSPKHVQPWQHPGLHSSPAKGGHITHGSTNQKVWGQHL